MTAATGFKICFVAHNAYSALTGRNVDHVGGVERQQAMMADWLSAQGNEVTVITWGQNESIEQNDAGVKLQYLCKKSAGLPVLRFIFPRWLSLIGALRKVDADIYYYNLGDLALGQIVAWSKRNRKTVVYSVSSESVCNSDLRGVLSLRERLFYRFGVRNVDNIIVQTATQSKLMREEFGRDTKLLPMPCADLAAAGNAARPPLAQTTPRVLWVGRLSKEKRPSWILDIAEKCPGLHFDVVGRANQNTDYSQQFLRRAGSMKNVAVHGAVKHDEIGRFYQNAQAIMCTSEYEGFPNVFLEAWSMGLPTVTTFDPDSIVLDESLGFVSSSVSQVADDLQALMGDDTAWLRFSHNARQYFLTHHEAQRALPLFANALEQFVDIAGSSHSVARG